MFVCAYTARLPISISDTMLKKRNGIATARMNRERTFTVAWQRAVWGEVCNIMEDYIIELQYCFATDFR